MRSSDAGPQPGTARLSEDYAASAPACRDFMSAFPSGVAAVTVVDVAGRALGFTCSSLCSVTLEPPTLLVCAKNNSQTLAAILQTGVFAVNLLHQDAQVAAELLASGAANRLAALRWEPSTMWGLPHLVADAHGLAECKLAGAHVVGSHTVVLGRITTVQMTGQPPLLYGLRRYRSWNIPSRRVVE